MTEFIVLALALMTASLLFVLVPLWRGGNTTADKRREANITIYHQRYTEIENEAAAGRLTRREAEAEKDALGARLLADIDAAPAAIGLSARASGKPWLTTLAVGALVVGGGGGAYWWLGDWRAVENAGMPNVQTMLGELQQQVNQHPKNLQARALLAHVEQSSGNFTAAAQNLHAINAALSPPNPALIAAEAEATMDAQNNLQGQARQLFAKALALDPQNRQALWYLGLAAAERGDKPGAIDYWNRLLKQQLPVNSRAMIKSRRAELIGHKPALK